MPTTLDAAMEQYLRAKALPRGTRNEYHSTLRKWEQWGGGVSIETLQRKDVRAFLDWVYERAVADQGTNPGRTVNKAREHLRAVPLVEVGEGTHRRPTPVSTAYHGSAGCAGERTTPSS